MENEIDNFLKYSTEIAKEHGIEIAIIHGFFKEYYYLSSMHDSKTSFYPSVECTVKLLPFWSESIIRELIAYLYLNKLI